jgi:hypothetical protein
MIKKILIAACLIVIGYLIFKDNIHFSKYKKDWFLDTAQYTYEDHVLKASVTDQRKWDEVTDKFIRCGNDTLYYRGSKDFLMPYLKRDLINFSATDINQYESERHRIQGKYRDNVYYLDMDLTPIAEEKENRGIASNSDMGKVNAGQPSFPIARIGHDSLNKLMDSVKHSRKK